MCFCFWRRFALCKWSIGFIVYQALYFPYDIGRDCAKCVCISILFFFPPERTETFFLMKDSLQSVILFVQQWRYNLTATLWSASDICRPLVHLGRESEHTELDVLVSVQDAWKLFCCNFHNDLIVFYRILYFFAPYIVQYKPTKFTFSKLTF